jgi:hypothetical protein
MSIVQETLGQFVCAMRGSRHEISSDQENSLYEAESGEIDTTCSRCGISINAKIDPKHPELYIITRKR